MAQQDSTASDSERIVVPERRSGEGAGGGEVGFEILDSSRHVTDPRRIEFATRG